VPAAFYLPPREWGGRISLWGGPRASCHPERSEGSQLSLNEAHGPYGNFQFYETDYWKL